MSSPKGSELRTLARLNVDPVRCLVASYYGIEPSDLDYTPAEMREGSAKLLLENAQQALDELQSVARHFTLPTPEQLAAEEQWLVRASRSRRCAAR